MVLCGEGCGKEAKWSVGRKHFDITFCDDCKKKCRQYGYYIKNLVKVR